ncbi:MULTISPECIES: helix-turn-helix transcriptional regulator [Providencia]|uniref:helix-turn-helix transcriptional regulator n=1 Tax=Providencia TaxID=586 RepID=UPI001E4A3EA0|nr:MULTISPECIES: WYL domain-containing protein [Providencia]
MAQEELATFSRNIQPDLTNPTPQLIIMVVQTALRTSFFSINDFQHFWLGLPSHHTGLHYPDLTLSATYFPLIHFLPTAGWSGYFLQGAFIMPKQEHRYDRLAIRLAILVSRLFMGESLNISQLAQEFGVSGRTVQRDLRERLRYLDTEYIDGHVSLRDARGPFRTNSDILRFAQITSVAHYFPVLDPKLLSVLLDNRQDPPCIVWNDPPRQAPALFDGFQVIVQSIIRNRLIRFLHREHLQSSIAPYRLICHDGEWYLAAVSKDRIQVFTLSAITDVVMTASSFARNRHIDRILQDPRFMRALPHFDYISGIIHK